MVHLVEDLVVGRGRQRAFPEGVVAVADEGFLEGEAGDERAERKDGQGHQHGERALMRGVLMGVVVAVGRDVDRPDGAAVHRMLRSLVVGRRPVRDRMGCVGGVAVMTPARLPLEGQKVEAPGIEGGHEHGDQRAQEAVGRTRPVRGESGLDDGVLGVEAGGEREPGQREGADGHHGGRERDMAAQAAHVADVLLVVHRVDDGAGAEEQERLEEGVREEVEDAGRVGADAEADEHIAELRAGRIGDNALDVVLHETDGGGEQRGRGADDDDGRLRGRGRLEERRQPRHHEHARGHHGGGMDERRDGGRAFHGIRQPGVQEELRRLAHGAHEEEQAGQRQGVPLVAEEPESAVRKLADARENRLEGDRVEQDENQEDAEGEAEVADPVDDESLDGGGAGRSPSRTRSRSGGSWRGRRPPSRRTSARGCRPSPA